MLHKQATSGSSARSNARSKSPALGYAASGSSGRVLSSGIAQLQSTLGNRALLQMLKSSRSIQREEAAEAHTESNMEAQEQPLMEQQNVSSAPIGEILAGPPAPSERDSSQKEADVEAARVTAERIIEVSESVAEVEAYFPALTARFGLAKIGWEGLGTADAALELQVNPKATIRNFNGLILNEGNTTQMNMLQQSVAFSTGTIDGENVGTKMVAYRLGPNHPQGGPPGAALNSLMNRLPTDPKRPATQKYIKGHLLNDNLGGPGEAANLYPITAQANKDHEQFVENRIKQWVNEQGYWVAYGVEAKTVNYDLSGHYNNNYIDADLECTVQKLDATGKRTSDGFSYTVRSRYNQGTNVVDNGQVTAEQGAAGAQKVPNFDKNQVEWSTTKGDPTQPQELDLTLADSAKLLRVKFRVLNLNTDTAYGALKKIISNLNEYHLNVLLDPDYDVDSLPFNDDITRAKVWNTAVNKLNEKAADVAEAMSDLAIQIGPIIGEYNQIGDREARKRVLRIANGKTIRKFRL